MKLKQINMKQFALVIVFSLLSMGLFSQKAIMQGNSKSLVEEVQKGSFEFEIPKSISADEVKRSADYYTDYFTVEFDEATGKATINMKENTPSRRRVIIRFLLSSGITTIDFEGKEYPLNDFYDKFLARE